MGCAGSKTEKPVAANNTHAQQNKSAALPQNPPEAPAATAAKPQPVAKLTPEQYA